ncbi:PKD domain-containing protein [Brachybacterium sacelli]
MCGAPRNTCESNGTQTRQVATDVFQMVDTGGATDAPEDGVNFEVNTLDTKTGDRDFAGYRCRAPGEPRTPAAAEAEPVEITMSVTEFAKLPIKAMSAHAGPEAGWIPVNMDVVLYATGESQMLQTELLGTPVAVRAVPTEYEWDMGDGNTLVTSDPGKPFPSRDVATTYSSEGWYDITLTTTFTGQFSVDGGEWQDIVGTVTVESDPVELFAKSLESRLVDGDVPVDEEGDPWVPERTSETEGQADPEATAREL